MEPTFFIPNKLKIFLLQLLATRSYFLQAYFPFVLQWVGLIHLPATSSESRFWSISLPIHQARHVVKGLLFESYFLKPSKLWMHSFQAPFVVLLVITLQAARMYSKACWSSSKNSGIDDLCGLSITLSKHINVCCK